MILLYVLLHFNFERINLSFQILCQSRFFDVIQSTIITMLYKSSLRLIISLFILQLTYSLASKHVPRFEVSSIDSRSVVVRILGARNVTRFDMTVQIFDLDRLKEFRKSELSTARYEDQVTLQFLMI